MSRRYAKSEEYLARALKTVPLGSQTFSKSKTQFPYGASPFFASKASGSCLYDVDGNKYIDFVNSLAAITLGYNDEDVTRAVAEQLTRGTIFSLANELEFLVSEQICEMVPCAEMVRFGKNGSDATSGAIRLARAFTGKDRVFVCGYHGWQDWYIGSTARYLGVPQATRELTSTFVYNDIQSLEKLFDAHRGQVAAVILEPAFVTMMPAKGFLEQVKEITHENGAVLVFDETVSGFRLANGGAQELFNVTPDLATFGKGLANGYPVAAIAGRRDIMQLMEKIFFSFTFGGELLSLAAAHATLTKLRDGSVIRKINSVGQPILNKLPKLIEQRNLQHIFSVAGYPSWSIVLIKDAPQFTSWELKTLLLQEMFERGIFTLGAHNLSAAHTPDDIEKALKCWDEYLALVQSILVTNDIRKHIKGEVLEPLFKIR